MIKEINAITPEYFKYRLEQEIEQYKQEIERLNNIIKEVREYIENKIDMAEQKFVSIPNKLVDIEVLNKLLEILDKGNVKAIPPEVIGTNGEDGGLFDYGDKGE